MRRDQEGGGASGSGGGEAPQDDEVFLQNVALALKERLAFSTYLEGSSLQSSVRYLAPDAQPPPAALLAAGEALQRVVLQRVRELQLLSDWPLLKPCRSQQQLQLILTEAEELGQQVWELLGSPDGQGLEVPHLPPQLQPHLLGPLDLLMALAGHLSPQPGQQDPKGGAAGRLPAIAGLSMAARPLTLQQLPRAALAQLVGLPALAGVPAPSLVWLRAFFKDLQPQQRHVGVDDRLLPWFRSIKVQAGEQLVRQGAVGPCRSFLRFGAPPSLRMALWETALGLAPMTEREEQHFRHLCIQVLEQPLLLDVLVQHEVASQAGDSSAFFLFDESIRPVLLAFLRDREVADHCAAMPVVAVQAASSVQAVAAQPAAASGAAAAGTVPYPPSAILPVMGLTHLVAPLSYLYDSPAAVYRLFRSMYSRYWCKLHSFSCCGLPAPALPGLCRTFDALIQELDASLVAHLQQLGLPPLGLALPWLLCGFVGVLPVEEVLLLWDRVLGLDSLLPLMLLAVAILCFRRQVLLSCHSVDEVASALSDLSQLQAVPLLQAVLFHG